MTDLFTWRETLAFTYDRPFHMTRNIGVYIRPTFSHDANTYQIACESNRAIWENLVTRNCVLEFWLMTELSEIKPILHEHSTMLIMLKYLICLRCCNIVAFLYLSSENCLWWRRILLESCKIRKTSTGDVLWQQL